MSIRLMDLALRAQGLDPVPKLVLTQIANHADDDGDSWCYMRELVDVTGRDERTVRRAVRSLEEAGLLVTNVRKADTKKVPSHLRPNAFRVVRSVLIERQPKERDRTPMTPLSVDNPAERPDTHDPSLGERGHPRPHRPDTGDPSRGDTHDPTESSTEPSTESSSSRASTNEPDPEPVDNDDDDRIISALVAAKLVRLINRGRRPADENAWSYVAGRNLMPGGSDHGQTLAVRALVEQGRDLPAAAAEVANPSPPMPQVVSLEARQIRSHVAALALADGVTAAGAWITDQDLPPELRDAAEAELARHTRSAS